MTTPHDDIDANSQRGEVEGRLHPSLYPREFWQALAEAFAPIVRGLVASSSSAGQGQPAFADPAPRPVDESIVP